MHDRFDPFHRGFRRPSIPPIRVAFALSLLLHAVVLWQWMPRLYELSLEKFAHDKARGPLVVQLAQAPSRAQSAPSEPAPAPALPTRSPPPKRAPAPKAAPRPAPPPPVAAQDRPAPAVVPPPETPSAAAPAPAPVERDFFAELEARRRARGAVPSDSDGAEKPATPDEERQRHNQIVAANLGLTREPVYGKEPTGGGIFQLQRVGFDDAEFLFFGWNSDIRRRARQTIEVRKGDAADIRVAVVRKMIAIIRDNTSGDFVWVSQRLGRSVTLSARPSENAGLEDFLMQEFFFDPRRPY
jgi:hypothetical protein